MASPRESAQVRCDWVSAWDRGGVSGEGITPNLAADGHMVPVRLSDGVHLNVAGSFLLAKAILEEVTAGVGYPNSSRAG
jgi:hypothetical protein